MPPLPNVTRHSGWRPYWVTPSIDRTLHQFLTVTDLDPITEFEFLPNYARFPLEICNGCGMPTEDAYSSRHLVLSHFGTCMCSNVETNLSWTYLVCRLLSFEHPSVILFCFKASKCRGNGFNFRFTILMPIEWTVLILMARENGRDLTQSYDKGLYTYRQIQIATWQYKSATKTSIT